MLEKGAYIAFDIETTGGNPEKNGITEIFALRYREGVIVDTFYSMVNPGVAIPPIVRRMTGITNKMV
ncbi:MAG: PolC-type DNA polymerase III, partial [Phycisphaerae bacterium]